LVWLPVWAAALASLPAQVSAWEPAWAQERVLLLARVSAQAQEPVLLPEAVCVPADARSAVESVDAERVSAPARGQASPVRAWLRDVSAVRALARDSAEPVPEAALRAAGPDDSSAARAGQVSVRAVRASPPVERVSGRSHRAGQPAEALRAALPVLPEAPLSPLGALPRLRLDAEP